MANYNFTEEEKQIIINDYIKNNLSYREIKLKYNIKSSSYVQTLLKDVKRSPSEANKLAHKKYPEKYKHSSETKDKIRKARLKFMREHPEETAWRKRNKPSYPEEMFIKFLNEKGYSNKYYIEREYSVYPFYIDFAFIDLKIAVEIDGSQHLEEDRKQKDIEKDTILHQNGWKIIRFSENVVKTDWDIIENTLTKYINKETSETFEKVGIIKTDKKFYLEKRNEYGRTQKQQERKNKFLAELPDKNILLEQIINNSFEEVGRKYNVTGNTIKKWCKNLGLPSTRKEIKQNFEINEKSD